MTSDALEPVNPDERVEVSVILRPRHSLDELETRLGQAPMSRDEYAALYGADPADVDRVAQFAGQHRLDVIESSLPRRTVRLAGRAADVGEAFGVSFHVENGYRVPSGPARLPPELQDVVQGVFGLDTRPVAHRLA